MNQITLTLKNPLASQVDFSRVRLDQWAAMTEDEIQQSGMHGMRSGDCVGDWWKVRIHSLEGPSTPRLVLQGDHAMVNGLGHQQRSGDILVEGNIGTNCGSCMTGGSITVRGDAGDGLGAPTGSRGVGMNGGVLRVTGNAGDLAGHRMRRGEIAIEGNAGDGLASWQVAGTIRVGGMVGNNIAFGMRRGTLILERYVALPSSRFTDSIELLTPFRVLAGLASENRWNVVRGDRSIGGIGEVWMPASGSLEAGTAKDNLLTIRR